VVFERAASQHRAAHRASDPLNHNWEVGENAGGGRLVQTWRLATRSLRSPKCVTVFPPPL
jgi:hypothetical protein